VVATHDGTSLKLYLDGALIGSQAQGNPSVASSARWSFGRQYLAQGSSYYPQKASLDDIAIYPSVLSATQIGEHYQASQLVPLGPGQTVYSYNSANQLLNTNVPGNDNDTSFAYDNNGNLTSETVSASPAQETLYNYDAADRLTGIDLPGTLDESYVYNAQDQRVQETSQGITNNLYYDAGEAVLREGTGSAAATHYLRDPGGGLIGRSYSATGVNNLAVVDPDYYHLDGMGSVVAVSDPATGEPLVDYNYDAFGSVTSSQGSLQQDYQYLSRPYNPASKLHNFHARSYSASQGRFIQADPVDGFAGMPQTLNSYAYGAGNPFKYPDPYGRCILSDSPICIEDKFPSEEIVKNIIENPTSLIPCWTYADHYLVPDSQDFEEIEYSDLNLGLDIAACAPGVGAAFLKFARPAAASRGATGSAASSKPYDNSRPGWRKGELQSSWDDAVDGPTGGKLCPDCGTEVHIPPNTGRPRDWDNDHWPDSWRARKEALDDMNAAPSQYRDTFNSETRLRCPRCNRADNQR
jgi:RHS repeat-associated protein